MTYPKVYARALATTTKPVIEQTCSTCPNFNNFYEPNGRGWCELFDHQARAHHEMTNNCVVSSETLIQQREISSVIDTKGERELITIEFATNIHPDETEYSYQHPQFVFGNDVEVKGSCSYPTITYKVCALELLENNNTIGKTLIPAQLEIQNQQ
ncbi:MAG TPA: hypothetical protein V6C71_00010 [Coleofasciculaceae cyanobacterium]|jgi:hypothetical protein